MVINKGELVQAAIMDRVDLENCKHHQLFSFINSKKCHITRLVLFLSP